MSSVNVTVVVDDAHQAQILEVAAALQACGLTVQQTLPNIGMICGTVDTNQVGSLAEVEGVAAVELDQSIQLPPPDSNIQ